MQLSTFHFPLSTLANQLPDLPAGPTLENVRGPIEASGFSTTEVAIAAILGGLIGALLIWLFLRSRKKPATPLSPEEAAMAELEASKQAGDDERFALLCANALRRFFAARFDLPATSQTSTELCRRLPIDEQDRNDIRDFLARCDGVKFARQKLSKERRIQLLDTAKALVDKFKTEEASAK